MSICRYMRWTWHDWLEAPEDWNEIIASVSRDEAGQDPD